MEIYPYKAQYLTGEPVELVMEGEPGRRYTCRLYSLEKCIREWEAVQETAVTRLALGGFDAAFGGYGVEVCGEDGREEGVTAFDVVSSPAMSLRYGFLSDFTAADGADDSDLDGLRKYHINMVQFYDWSRRHDDLVSEEEAYTDMMGKQISRGTVLSKISKCREYGMKPMAYGAVYAASREFFEKHRDWAYYNSAGKPFCFIDTFFIMNIGEGSPWREHIVGQYANAVRMGFAGIHMDTYGFPKTAFSMLEGGLKRVELKEAFAPLIGRSKQELDGIDRDNYLVFNNVGNWPVEPVAGADVQAVYIEVWPPYERYHHIKQIIAQAARASEGKKPVILAAYLAPFRLEERERAGFAAYLLTAAIVSNGAYHLLLGEKDGVLTQGYYSDYSLLDGAQAAKLRLYYDFMIRYMSLFYDMELTDVTMTHLGWDNYEYQCGFPQWSAYGEAGKVWVTVREKPGVKTIHLVNLCGCGDDLWNRGKEEPIPQSSLAFSVQVDGPVECVCGASPDEGGRMIRIPYDCYETDKGCFVKFTVERLAIWKLIYIRVR